MRKGRRENAGVVQRRHQRKEERKFKVDEKERKEESDTNCKMERKVDHNLLCNMKEKWSKASGQEKARDYIAL